MIQVSLHEAKIVEGNVLGTASGKISGAVSLKDPSLNIVDVYCNQPADARRIADAFARLAAEMDKANK